MPICINLGSTFEAENQVEDLMCLPDAVLHEELVQMICGCCHGA